MDKSPRVARRLCDTCCGTGVIFLPSADDCRRSPLSCAADGCSCEIACERCEGTGLLPPSEKTA